jgi:hypothetical protein
MQTEIHAAYEAAQGLLQDLHHLETLRQYSGDQEQTDEFARAVGYRGLYITEPFKQIYPLMEYCYAAVGSCDFEPNDNWVAATISKAAMQQADHVLRQGLAAKHHKENLSYSKGLLAALCRRLLLEKSVLLRECPQYLATLPQPEQATLVPDTQPLSKPEQPQPEQPDSTAVNTTTPSDREIAFSFLLLWHKYGTADFTADPVPGRAKFPSWMQANNPDKKPIPDYSTVWRLLRDMFGSKPKYVQACRNGTLEPVLKIANREGAQVFQGNKDRVRSTTDPELDLD